MPDLHLRAVSKDFGASRVVDDISLTFRHGELTALLGPSGCGKTTLLRMIAGLESPTSGRLMLGDADMTDVPAHKRRFGMVFQNFALFPHMTVAENVAYALTIAGAGKVPRMSRAKELLDLVKLADFGARRIGELSGGQRQRVAIARALAQEPEVFLLDEPMSALDAKLREEMQVELRLLQQRLKITTIVVTHDQREAMTMADSIVVMASGRAEQVGAPQEVYHAPRNAFVADFIGRSNFFDGRIEAGGLRLGDTWMEVSPAPNFIDGSAVKVACRPEKLTLAADGPASNRIAARVSFVRTIGPARDVYLDSPVGSILVEDAAGGAMAPCAVGEMVSVHVPPAAFHIFPAKAAA